MKSNKNRHPYGVEPEGNALLVGQAVARRLRMQGFGPWLGAMSDTVLVEWLHHMFPAELCAVACCSGALLALVSIEDPWKALFLKCRNGTELKFLGSWKASVLGQRGSYRNMRDPKLYSDLLYQPFRVVRARSEMARHEIIESVQRITKVEFLSQEKKEDRPFVVSHWLSFPSKDCGNALFIAKPEGICHAGGYEIKVKDFISYAQSNYDDRPLYVFDKRFLDESTNGFEPNDEESDDLFRYLSKDWRPDHRWLIAGGPGSGSTWHIDPNGTSAWNLCLSGRKRWFFSKTPPPGVHPSADGLDIATPVSVIDWYLAFYQEARGHIFECQAQPGDLVYVPGGWYHSVLNTDHNGLTVAITRNFCSPAALPRTLRLLRDRPHLISGLGAHKDVHEDSSRLGRAFSLQLDAALRRHRPDLLDKALIELNRPTSLWDKILRRPSPLLPESSLGSLNKQEKCSFDNRESSEAASFLSAIDTSSPSKKQRLHCSKEDSSFSTSLQSKNLVAAATALNNTNTSPAAVAFSFDFFQVQQ